MYADLYKDPVRYEEILGTILPSELNFYLSYVKEAKNVLYLGSGSGRLLKEFIKVNPNITGVEISTPMYDYSKKLLPNTRVLNADFFKLNLEEKFDLIIAPFVFMYHFEEPEFKKSFSVVKKYLNQGGLFVGDVFNPYLPLDRTIEYELENVAMYGDEFEKAYIHYDHEKKLCNEYIERTNMKTGQTYVTLLPWYYYYPEEFEQCAKENGLKVKEFYGSFYKDAFDSKTSEVLIFVVSS